VTLSYCMNVHPGETLDEVLDLLAGPVRRVREAWCPDRPMGVGLWLPRAAAREIAEHDGAAERTRAALDEAGLFAFTANAFPIGGFHQARVKREVYRPTWDGAERLDFTRQACLALARLLPAGARGSVSTVPLSYKAFGAVDLDEAARNLARLTIDLARLEDETGHELALALEPEPLATLETTPEAIRFLHDHVFAGAGRALLVDHAGWTPTRAEQELRRRVGVCVDTCHLACEFEDLSASLASLAAAGVRVVKAQLSSALELRSPAQNAAGRRRLRGFEEPRYLHQTLGQTADGELRTCEDLPDLLLGDEAALAPGFADVAVLRTHFHVPLCWAGDETLGTTRPTLEAGLADLARATDHLEVETYTFGVLPAADAARFGGDVVHMVRDELRWADTALAEATSS
jgi:hypothetical protein